MGMMFTRHQAVVKLKVKLDRTPEKRLASRGQTFLHRALSIKDDKCPPLSTHLSFLINNAQHEKRHAHTITL